MSDARDERWWGVRFVGDERPSWVFTSKEAALRWTKQFANKPAEWEFVRLPRPNLARRRSEDAAAQSA